MQRSSLRRSSTTPTESSVNKYCEKTGEEIASETVVAVESPSRIPYPHLLDLELRPEEEKAGSRWHLYHTPTGRLTGFLRQRYKHNHTEQKDPKSPWKPPFTSPMHGPMARTQDPNSPTPVHGPTKESGNRVSRTAGVARIPSPDIQTSHSADHTSQHATYNQPRTSTIMGEEPSQTHDKGRASGLDYLENGLACSRGREIMMEGAEMRLKVSALTKRNDISKQECQEQALDYRYLQFVSEVTRDILSASVLSQPALDLLCRMHMDRHKHSLREDEMMKRLDELKMKIGIL